MAESGIVDLVDLHASDNLAEGPHDGAGFYRHQTSWSRRLDEVLATANGLSPAPNVFVQGGDVVCGGASENQKLSLLQQVLAKLDDGETGSPCDVIHTLGHHIVNFWDGEDSAPLMSDYFDELDGASSTGTRANLYGPDSEAYAYTYDDSNGLRFICINFPYGNKNLDVGPNEDYLDYLTTQLANAASSNIPCIVFSHCQLWQNANAVLPAPASGFTPPNEHWTTLQTIYDGAPTLQMVLSGHLHRAEQSMKRNGVWFVGPRGSVALKSGEEDTGNAYIYIQIKPQEIWTPYGMKANIKITNYGYNGNAAQDYDAFAAA